MKVETLFHGHQLVQKVLRVQENLLHMRRKLQQSTPYEEVRREGLHAGGHGRFVAPGPWFAVRAALRGPRHARDGRAAEHHQPTRTASPPRARHARRGVRAAMVAERPIYQAATAKSRIRRQRPAPQPCKYQAPHHDHSIARRGGPAVLLALPHSGVMSLRLKPRQMASAPASIACPQDLVGTVRLLASVLQAAS